MKKLATLLGAIIAVLLAVAACSGDGENGGGNGSANATKSVVESVPADTAVLVSARVKDILLDVDIRNAFGTIAAFLELDSGSLEQGLAAFAAQTGFNPTEVGEMLFVLTESDLRSQLEEGDLGGGSIVSSGDDGDGGSLALEDFDDLPGLMFITGSYLEETVLAAIGREEGAPLVEVAYKGETIHEGAEDKALAFLQDDLVVTGTKAGLRAVIDVRAGDAPALSGDLPASYNALGAPWLKVAAAIPPGLIPQEEPSGGTDVFLDIDPAIISSVSFVTIVGDKVEQDISLRIVASYPMAGTATRGAEIINGILGFVRVFVSDPDALGPLRGLHVTAGGQELRISFTTPLQDLLGGLDALGQIGSAF